MTSTRNFYAIILIGLLALTSLSACKNETVFSDIKSSTNTRIGDMIDNDTSGGFARAYRDYSFSFPEDHGPHNNFKQEKWQFVGNLVTTRGKTIAYQISFHRIGLAAATTDINTGDYISLPSPDNVNEPSNWRTKELYLASLTLTDVDSGKFYQSEKISRNALDLSHVVIRSTKTDDEHSASSGNLDFKIDNWSISSTGTGLFPMHVSISHEDIKLDLSLYAKKRIVFNGTHGKIQKGSETGNAAYSYSYPRIKTTGDITISRNKYRVKGESWYEHEWGTDIQGDDIKGVDWFVIHLNDGRELCFNRIHNEEGDTKLSHGFIVFTTEKYEKINAGAFEFIVHNKWVSPNSGTIYPVSWDIRVPKYRLSLHITPAIESQEVRQARTYWEGSIKIAGYQNMNSDTLKTINGQGFMRLAGYGAK